MAIAPFKDRPGVNIDYVRVQAVVSGGMETSAFNRFRQGVSVRDFCDFGQKLIPYMSSKGVPDRASARFDHEIDILNFGQPKLFEDLGPEPSAKFLPFDDIADLNNPVAYINDPGTMMYPVVLVSPNWIDPGEMDGIIEPLAVRHKMSNARAAGPFVDHDIRATLMPNVGSEIVSRSTQILSFIEFEPRSKNSPYFDSQDQAANDGNGFSMSLPGYDYPEEVNLEPFDDKNFIASEILQEFYSQTFTDNFGCGIYGKMTTTGFQMRDGSYAALKGFTGNQYVNGVDSIAFGGFLK
jgi:hypothetical protein